MEIKFFCPRWGSEHLEWPVFIEKIKRAGYDGIEWGIGKEIPPSEIESVLRLADQHGVKIIAQHYDTTEADYSQHFDQYGSWLKKIAPYNFLKINSQTGRDFFSFNQNSALIKLAGDKVIHETHRGKFSFAAHFTKDYLEKIPALRLTLDISHWFNVAESFLADQQSAVALSVMRTSHIHARVGFTQGPQVPDPRDPNWLFAVEEHLKVWDRIVKIKRDTSNSTSNDTGNDLTITPEFGPYPYLTHGADQWEMNLHMLKLLKRRYG
jgi:sugar phosphate isomerase/epimerase